MVPNPAVSLVLMLDRTKYKNPPSSPQYLTNNYSRSYLHSPNSVQSAFEEPPSSTMASKAQLAVCLLVLVAVAGLPEAQAACNIYSMVSCLAYAKGYQTPNAACCNAIKALGTGPVGSKCLCSIMTSSTAHQYGVVPQAAVGMPHRCGLSVPYHSTCGNLKVPGGW